MQKQIITEPNPILNRRIVMKNMSIKTKCYDIDVELTVPKGFIYDGASIPWILWSIVGTPYSCKFDTPSSIHDYLYSPESNNKVKYDGKEVTMDRFNSDYLMYELLCENKVNHIIAYLMFVSLRCFGFLYYKNKRTT